MAESNINREINYTRVGLNTDNIIDQIQKGYVTDCLNGIILSWDGHSLSYQNEEGSVFCLNIPKDYVVIGREYIPQLNEVLYMLTNPITGNSLVGYVLNNNCKFEILLDDSIPGSDLLKLSIDHPILKFEVKTTNCSTQVYFTDAFNPRRFLDFNNLPWKDLLVGGILVPQIGQIDSNKIKVQPNFKVMHITPTEESVGGNVVEGTYQFAACYSDISSNKLTAYSSASNPVSIFNKGIISPNFNDITNKAISIVIDNIDTSGLYSYITLAVIKTINAITTVEFVGNFSIQSDTYKYTYTGNEASGANIKLTITDILEQFPYYDLSTTLCQVDNTIVWGGLTKEDPLNYQAIWAKVKVGWGTWKVPETSLEDYANGITSANLRGHHRDEVYPLEGCFTLDNGMETPRCTIPARVATAFDLEPISTSNPDVEGYITSTCQPVPTTVPRWQVYNTGSVTNTEPDYNPGYNCPQPYQYGEMSYWESTKHYPNNPIIWGDLADKPMRHHKFPDVSICPIHDENPYPIGSSSYNNYVHNIYPIGFKVDINSLREAINNSSLTDAQKRSIVGFKIMRGDRGAEKSIVAKGVVYNCGHYNKDGQDYYYANYPLNDTNPDHFISSTPVPNKSGTTPTPLKDFQQNRFTFHSPDTHFYQPNGIEGSYLKLETIETGTAKCHFVPVQDNAREKIRTKYALEIAFITGILSTIGIQFNHSSATTVGTEDLDTTTNSVTPTLDIQNFFPTYNTTLEILDKLSPWINYGWQYNCLGFYGNSTPVPNNGNKIRNINFGGYITSGLNGTFGDNYPINNTNRESSVYLSVEGGFPFAGNDNSRQTASQANVCNSTKPFYTEIASYYASIKRYLPDQYGEIFSYTPVDTGFYSNFVDKKGVEITSIPTIFGGDIFINRFAFKIKQPFYNISSVNKPDGTDVNYNQDPDPTTPSQDYTQTGNIGYPVWYYSTDNVSLDIANTFGPGITNLTNLFNTTGGIALLILTGGLALVAVMLQLVAELFGGVFFNGLGLKVTNLECNNYSTSQLWETGMAYLYAYGIPYYFCESEVNADMRQATNMKEGNFYPQVSSDIPDSWLQETNVPIIYDNTYNYNKTYSKQNKETYFSLLRPDWQPDQLCYINYNNRAIWSDKSDLEETKNNWLVYRPANMKEFPKNFGNLQALDYLENRSVLVRYENHSQIYNALATVATSQLTASLGTGELFSGTPLDLKTTDTGFAGTQNKWIINTEHGHIYVDAKRGQIILLKGNEIENLSDPKYLNSMFFTNNLPFKILESFPGVNTDNNYNGIGLHGTYDAYYHRFIITKLDYSPVRDDIYFDGINFYIFTNEPGSTTCCPEGQWYDSRSGICVPSKTLPIDCPPTKTYKQIVQLTDTNYFCNQSWTMSFSFLTNTWSSFHSYTPNYYTAYENYFQSGYNLDKADIWDHNSTYSIFNNYRGTAYPYIIETPYSYKYENEILQSIKEYCTILKYTSYNQYIEVDSPVYFDSVIVYNNNQNSGVRDLIIKSNTNLQQNRQYPKYNTDSISILVTKNENFYQYNMIWDVVKNFNIQNWLDNCSPSAGEKKINQTNMNYNNQSYKKYLLRAKDSKIRSTLLKSDYKFISRFIVEQTQKSF